MEPHRPEPEELWQSRQFAEQPANGETTISAPTKVKRQSKSYKTELKKSQARENRIILLAMLGWSLALVEMVVFIVLKMIP